VYDEKEKKYFYYVERLLGRKIEFEQRSVGQLIINNELNLFDHGESSANHEVKINDANQITTGDLMNDSNVRPSRPVGRQWILYVNNQEQDWQQICEQGKKISYRDEVIWKFQLPTLQVQKKKLYNH